MQDSPCRDALRLWESLLKFQPQGSRPCQAGQQPEKYSKSQKEERKSVKKGLWGRARARGKGRKGPEILDREKQGWPPNTWG